MGALSGGAEPGPVGPPMPTAAESEPEHLGRDNPPYQWGATGLAMAGVALTVAGYMVGIRPMVPRSLGGWCLGAILVLFTGAFSFAMFRVIGRHERQLAVSHRLIRQQRDALEGLWEATALVNTTADLEIVLQKLAELARELLGARYAAVAVVSPADPVQLVSFVHAGMDAETVAGIGAQPTGRGLVGAVLRASRPIRLDQVSRHPDAVGFPPGHPPMESFLGIPLIFQGTAVGSLYLTEKPGGFTAEDEVLGELFARQAAVVVANAQLIQERERLATIAERERISADLHDGVLQNLYGITLGLDLLLDTPGALSADASASVRQSVETIGLTMTDIRLYIQSLAASSVDLKIVLADLVTRMGLADRVRFAFQDTDYLKLHPDVIHDLVLSAQEALSNAVRHGQADRIAVGWRGDGLQGTLTVTDNGTGFDPTRSAADRPHFGLANIERRMARWQGTIDVDSALGQGTTVTLCVPLDAAKTPSVPGRGSF